MSPIGRMGRLNKPSDLRQSDVVGAKSQINMFGILRNIGGIGLLGVVGGAGICAVFGAENDA